MTLAAWDHRELHPRGSDNYSRPRFEGYPDEGDKVEIVYRSKRTGELTETTGTVEHVDDHSTYGGGTAHPSYLELVVDDGRERELRVWGGGGYGPKSADVEGEAPAQVFTRGLVKDGHGGRTWRTNGLGRLVTLRVDSPGVTFEVTVKNVPEDALDGAGTSMEDRLEHAVYDRFKRDSNGLDLLDVEVARVELDR